MRYSTIVKLAQEVYIEVETDRQIFQVQITKKEALKLVRSGAFSAYSQFDNRGMNYATIVKIAGM